MKGSRLLIGLLFLATVLVDCTVVPMAVRDSRSFGLPLAWALQLSQVSLAAIWLALGRTSAPLRSMGVVVTVGLWSWALARLPLGPSCEEWVVVLTAQTVTVSLPLLVGRLAGVRLEGPSPAEDVEDSATGPRRRQFSIAYLLAWMTALAVALGTLQYIAPYERLSFALLLQSNVWVFLLGGAMLAWSSLWAVLGTRELVTRISVLCAVVIVTLAFFLARFPQPEKLYVSIILLQVLLLASSLGVFRMAGYRLKVGRER